MERDGRVLVKTVLAEYGEMMHIIGLATVPDWLDIDLSMAQMKALFVLGHDGEATIGTLADRLGVGLSAASHLVDRLVHLGVVERAEDPLDRRRTLARLAPTGEALVTRFRAGNQDRLCGWLHHLDDVSLTALHTGLASLLEVARCSRSSDTREATEAGDDHRTFRTGVE